MGKKGGMTFLREINVTGTGLNILVKERGGGGGAGAPMML